MNGQRRHMRVVYDVSREAERIMRPLAPGLAALPPRDRIDDPAWRGAYRQAIRAKCGTWSEALYVGRILRSIGLW
jgi:hypothetical protein